MQSTNKSSIQFISSTDRHLLTTFDNVKALNDAVSTHMTTLKANSCREQIMQLLSLISKHSVKMLGVSWMSNQTMATHLNVSTRTVQRYIKELIELDIIAVYQTKDIKRKGQTSNTLVIKNVENANVEPVKADCRTACHTKQSLKKHNKSNTRIRNAHESPNTINLDSDSSFLKDSLPAALYNTLKIFNAEEIYNLTGIIYRAKALIDRSIQIEDHSKDFTGTIKAVILKAKTSKIKNFNNYLYRSIQATTAAISRRSAPSQPNMSWLAGGAS
ncbi:helix-turn-helix domain-containing protein [Alkalihalophilus marmarensis]|uniref:Helix-turn-helix type 11 domain-containing protein n=1 Tax=Alkalihalophilus marmarensis DSM 21297 TaxID=1188261 RepID=U6SRF5_9BACI|nr:helix-turn-helix domain-containing protein [Alkalihalophilus marmarensis]ERN54299.1 hypothetical protein A33I_07685 [Alkalihalophilus marmarensis DSM 21297]